jgi:hypothetical protein
MPSGDNNRMNCMLTHTPPTFIDRHITTYETTLERVSECLQNTRTQQKETQKEERKKKKKCE